MQSAATLLFENARIRISDFRLPPGVTGGHTHEHPALRWQVCRPGEAPAIANLLDAEAPTTIADKAVFWQDQGQHFSCTNAHERDEFRQIVWEFKQPPRRSPERVRQLLDSAVYSTEVGTSLLFENEYCRAWDFYLEPGEGDIADAHHHVLDYCFVYVAPGRLLGSHHDGRPGLFDSINDDNDVTWFDIPDGAASDPTFAHGGKNGYDDRPMREYLVELK